MRIQLWSYGAATTGLLDDDPLLTAAHGFERMTYNLANGVVVISEALRQNLLAKGPGVRRRVGDKCPDSVGVRVYRRGHAARSGRLEDGKFTRLCLRQGALPPKRGRRKVRERAQ